VEKNGPGDGFLAQKKKNLLTLWMIILNWKKDDFLPTFMVIVLDEFEFTPSTDFFSEENNIIFSIIFDNNTLLSLRLAYHE
jgi:hypothetical protein